MNIEKYENKINYAVYLEYKRVKSSVQIATKSLCWINELLPMIYYVYLDVSYAKYLADV